MSKARRSVFVSAALALSLLAPSGAHATEVTVQPMSAATQDGGGIPFLQGSEGPCLYVLGFRICI